MLKKIASFYGDPGALSFLAGMLVFGAASGLFGAVFNNYLYDILHIGRVERGIVEFPRELPGLLLILIMALLYRFSEVRVMYAAYLVSFVGLVGLGLLGASRLPAIVFIVAWSAGEHMMMPVRASVGVHLAKPGKQGLALGGVSSAGNIGQVIGKYTVPLVFLVFPLIAPRASRFAAYRTVFFIGAVILVVGLVVCGRIKDQHQHIKRGRLYFRKKFTKYYILEMFFGARKQVFVTFAPYVLIIRYGAGPELIASLSGIWSVASIVMSPILGRLIDRLGYKKIIVADAVMLVVLCFMYGFAGDLFPEHVAFLVICVVFVIDALLFGVGMARTVYVKSLSDSQEEVTSTLSTGTSINHLISIVIAIIGGVLWEKLGMETLFCMAGLFGIGSVLFSSTLPRRSGRGATVEVEEEGVQAAKSADHGGA